MTRALILPLHTDALRLRRPDDADEPGRSGFCSALASFDQLPYRDTLAEGGRATGTPTTPS